MTRSLLALAGLAALLGGVGCHDAATAPDESTPELTLTDGPLRLSLSDAPARPGVLFISAAVTGGTSTVAVTSTRYGSLCAVAVTGHADVAAGVVTLRIAYAERAAASCPSEIRALTYRATVSGLAPGAYEVRVVHTQLPDGATGTVFIGRVTVS